jgi:hypothetical protein
LAGRESVDVQRGLVDEVEKMLAGELHHLYEGRNRRTTTVRILDTSKFHRKWASGLETANENIREALTNRACILGASLERYLSTNVSIWEKGFEFL